MALFSFLKKINNPVQATMHADSHSATPDRLHTELAIDLLKAHPKNRDQAWEKTLFDYLPTAAFATSNPDSVYNAEGYPMFILNEPAEHARLHCIENLIEELLLEKGLGITIKTPEVHWEFSYGELLNFYMNHEFVTRESNEGAHHIDMTKRVQVLKKGEEVMLAQPSEKYLPAKARNVIRKFLKEAGVTNPKILLLCRKSNGLFGQQLAFDLQKNLTNEEQHVIMQKLTWYLPRHYTAVCFREGADMKNYFEKL